MRHHQPPARRAVAGPPAVRAPALRPGDLVAVVSPAGPVAPDRVATGIALLRSWGLRPVPATHAFERAGYLAGADARRLADLRGALTDPRVRGVMVTRGGYGTQRIVDRLDLAPLRRDPKVVVGFSDLTALHLALWRAARLATVYGPGAAWRPERTGDDAAQALREVVMTTDPVVVRRDSGEPSAAASLLGPAGFPGAATGPLLGGNLCLLAATVGTPDFPDLAGAILLLEEVGEAPYKVDRMLTQLGRAGALGRLAGVVLGQFVGCADGWGTDVAEVLADRLGELGVPVLGGLPIGHGPGQRAVPLGVPAAIDVAAGTLTVSPAVH